MGKKFMFLALAVSLGLNAGLVAVTLLSSSDQVHHGRPPEHPVGQPPDPSRLVDNHVQGISRHLGLSPDQQQAIRVILERHAPQLVERQRHATELRIQLSDVFAAPEFDDAWFQQLTKETSEARKEVDSLSAVMLVGEAAVLTHEQRMKYAQVAPIIHSQPPGPHGGNPPPRH